MHWLNLPNKYPWHGGVNSHWWSENNQIEIVVILIQNDVPFSATNRIFEIPFVYFLIVVFGDDTLLSLSFALLKMLNSRYCLNTWGRRWNSRLFRSQGKKLSWKIRPRFQSYCRLYECISNAKDVACSWTYMNNFCTVSRFIS